MPMIIRNNVRYATGSGGSGNTDIKKLTQAEYDALPDSKYTDGVLYAITDGESGSVSKPVELTRAQYEALGDSVLNDNILYAITDGDGLSAKNLAFDDSETQLGVNNVQDAIVKQNKKIDEQNKKWTKIANTTGTYDVSLYKEFKIFFYFENIDRYYFGTEIDKSLLSNIKNLRIGSDLLNVLYSYEFIYSNETIQIVKLSGEMIPILYAR